MCDPVCVFVQHPPHSDRFTDMLSGELEARSCFPFEGVYDCVCVPSVYPPHLLSDLFFPESDLVFLCQ